MFRGKARQRDSGSGRQHRMHTRVVNSIDRCLAALTFGISFRYGLVASSPPSSHILSCALLCQKQSIQGRETTGWSWSSSRIPDIYHISHMRYIQASMLLSLCFSNASPMSKSPYERAHPSPTWFREARQHPLSLLVCSCSSRDIQRSAHQLRWIPILEDWRSTPSLAEAERLVEAGEGRRGTRTR